MAQTCKMRWFLKFSLISFISALITYKTIKQMHNRVNSWISYISVYNILPRFENRWSNDEINHTESLGIFYSCEKADHAIYKDTG